MKQSWLAIAFMALSTVGSAASLRYYAPVPPPPLRVESYGVAPGPGLTWVGGYWGWQDGRYAWVPGSWRRPPHARSVWAPGYWEHRRDGRYGFHEGRWR
jgi:hypothetical protein